MKRVIVLSDGETWETLEGEVKTEVWTITDRAYELLEAGYRPRHLEPEDVIKTEVIP